MRPLIEETFNSVLLQVQKITNRDDLIQILERGLVQYFQFDFAGVYKKMGLGNRYTRMHMYSEAELWNEQSVPDTLQLNNFKEEIVIETKHPSPYLTKDPFAKGMYLLGVHGQDQSWMCYAFKKNPKKETQNGQFELFCQTVVNTWTLLELHEARSTATGGDLSHTALNDLNEQLLHANDELKQFAYRASHDLQEPLRTVSNYIGLFNKHYGSELNEEAAEYLGFAKDASERMHRMVRDLLEYTRLDHQNNPKIRISGNQLLEEALANIKMSAEENEAIILYEDMPDLEGYEKQLVSLFQNLLDNAIKFKGNGQPVVTIDVNEKQKSWEFRVSDNGIGISEDFKDKIFNFFSKLHAASEYKGSGLGLSICKKIVENHNGQISVDSQEGQGSTFIFELAR